MDRRYQKRMSAYWHRAKKKAIAGLERLNFSTWFDFWHTHPDWYSKGNRFPENRAMVAKITYELLCYAEKLSQLRSEPIQIFATICEDTASNAVYIHTENPNGTPFPDKFTDTIWDAPPPPELVDVVNEITHIIGKQIFSDETIYIIHSRRTYLGQFL